MNTYDPADYIVYVSMSRTISIPDTPSVPAEHRLASGYANESPATTLRTRPASRASGDRRNLGRRGIRAMA